jgi:hypothetical protein
MIAAQVLERSKRALYPLQGGDGADAARSRNSFRERQPRRQIGFAGAVRSQLHIQESRGAGFGRGHMQFRRAQQGAELLEVDQS